jgi:hypothetical protein
MKTLLTLLSLVTAAHWVGGSVGAAAETSLPPGYAPPGQKPYQPAPVAVRPAPVSGAESLREETMSPFLAKGLRALQGIRDRIAVDETLKAWAPTRVVRGYNGLGLDNGPHPGVKLTHGKPAPIEGIRVCVIENAETAPYSLQPPMGERQTIWKTDTQKTFIGILSLTIHPAAHERLVRIVSEELQKQGIRVLPEDKSK